MKLIELCLVVQSRLMFFAAHICLQVMCVVGFGYISGDLMN